MRAGDDMPGLAVIGRNLAAARGAVVTTLLNMALLVLKQRYRRALDGNGLLLKVCNYLKGDDMLVGRAGRVQMKIAGGVLITSC